MENFQRKRTNKENKMMQQTQTIHGISMKIDTQTNGFHCAFISSVFSRSIKHLVFAAVIVISHL